MFIFFFLLIAILIIVFVCVGKSKSDSPSSYTSPTYLDEPSYISDRRPRISAEVNEDFYESVQEYCQKNSMTISSLIRKAVEAYIGSDSSFVSASVGSTPRRSAIIKADGSWKCPLCGKINAGYVGTCACGGTKDSIPNPTPRRPSYIRADGSWKCPKCGTINASYVGTCSCGRDKS